MVHPVVLSNCDGRTGSQWTLTEAGELKNPQSGRCLDIVDPASGPGAPLQLWDCTGASTQKWSFDKSGWLKSATGNCAQTQSLAAGARVVLIGCIGTPVRGNGQSWVRDFTLLTGDGSQRCLDVRAGNSARRAPVAIYDCTGGFNQGWFSEPAPSAPGADRLISYAAYAGSLSFRCLAASGTANGSVVNIDDCSDSDLQRWRRTNSGKLINVASSRCLQVSGGSTANGAALSVGDCRSFFNSYQLWGTR